MLLVARAEGCAELRTIKSHGPHCDAVAAEWVKDEQRAIPLYSKILWAAGMNGHDEALKASAP